MRQHEIQCNEQGMSNCTYNFTCVFFGTSCVIEILQEKFVKAVVQNKAYAVAIFRTFYRMT